MFDKNMLKFNPGWDRTKATLPDFDDVHDIQKMLKSREPKLTTQADERQQGPPVWRSTSRRKTDPARSVRACSKMK